MIICSHSNIDIIQGVIGYGDVEGITDWRITNTITNTNAGILNILNSTSTNVRVSILENGNVGIGTTNPVSMLDIVGDTNITGVYKKNNRDVINDTSNYVLSTSNVLVPRILTEVGNGSNYISRLISPINTRIDNTSNYILSTSNILANGASSQWTNMSLGIYYAFPYITSSPLATTGITGNYTYMVFTYTTEIDRSGTGQSLYTINVPATGVVCDILLVGGGAGGGKFGGGGGGGAILFGTNITLNANSSISIKVGNGGAGAADIVNSGINGVNGVDSSITISSTEYFAKGGGGGGTRTANPTGINGSSGGSGGGGSHGDSGTQSQGGISNKNTYAIFQSFGNTGGRGKNNATGNPTHGSGGGGGAGSVGSDFLSITGGGNGGTGKEFITYFGTEVGHSGWFGGGGGGNSGWFTGAGNGGYGNGGNNLLGGGGNGGLDGNTAIPATNGLANTGGGGGGGKYTGTGSSAGGNGGSGIVIIRFLSSAANVGANVGIGTTNPISKLHICDDKTNITKLTIQNNYTIPLPTEITVTGATSTTLGTTERCISFPYTSDSSGLTGQTQYTFTPSEALNCDMLLVGGGGGGSGAGGGAGGYLYYTNINLAAGSYTVRVGNGGTGSTGTTNGNQGANSTFSGGSINYIAYGGGGGGGNTTGAPSYSGLIGSYGGTGMDFNQVQTYTPTQGNRGGNGIRFVNYGSGGGGGGAGAIGGDAEYVSGFFADPGNTIAYSKGGQGGNGMPNTITGRFIYYAGGGTGGANTDTTGDTNIQVAPLGGGGIGARNINGNGGNGTDGLGGGGGGGDYQRSAGARGGSGIIIIRYRRQQQTSIELIRGTSTDSNIDYKIGNYNGDFKIVSSTSSVDTDFIKIISTGASIYNPTGSPQWSTVSDRRIKENIEKASYDKCYDNINKLELYRFNYIKELNSINKDLKQLGYIAQEVQDIFPKAVSIQDFHNDNLSIPNMLSIDIAQINYSLYGAVKKLIEMYTDIEKNINILENILKIDNTNIITFDTSNVVIDSSNVVIDSSNVVIDSSNVVIDSSNMVIDSSNVVIDSSNMVIDSSNVVIDSSNVVIDYKINELLYTKNAILYTCNMILDNSNVVIDNSNVVIDNSNVVIESSNVVIESSNVVIESSNVVIEDTSMLA